MGKSPASTTYFSSLFYLRSRVATWTFHAFGPDDEVKLASIAVHFPVAVYEGVEFPPEHDDTDFTPA
ncbi:MAG: hypothetical protein ACYDER_20215 [Ktedonobacteraceae bacterium]